MSVHAAAPLTLAEFGAGEDPLNSLQNFPQGEYLKWYLADLGATTVLIEPNYFDRDYLSEFSAFYCTSSAGYKNACQRLHYFSIAIDRALLEKAIAGDGEAATKIRGAYLGFIVRRPIPGTPFGRTVLRWYPEQTPALPRVTDPARVYTCNVAGLQLEVTGLAWQQQDQGVGACATIALWTMLHSSAFDDRHVVPTTAEVTQTAHRAGLSEAPMFPSTGLTAVQLIAALRDSGFAPFIFEGELRGGRFGRERFCSSLASLIRSGYPVVIAGSVESDDSGHAVCAVGFRQAASNIPPGFLEMEDANTEFVYVHDDNLGPAARFHVEIVPSESVVATSASSPVPDSVTVRFDVAPTVPYVALRAMPPPQKHSLTLPDPTAKYPRLIPTLLLAAAHQEVRTSPDRFHFLGMNLGAALIPVVGGRGLSTSTRMIRLADYARTELGRILAANPPVLGATRLALWESVPPMSLHLGVVRFGAENTPLLDVIYDTTDSAPNLRAFCYLAYDREMFGAVDKLRALGVLQEVGVADLGVGIKAF